MEEDPPAKNQQSQKDPENRAVNRMGETEHRLISLVVVVETCRMVLVLRQRREIQNFNMIHLNF